MAKEVRIVIDPALNPGRTEEMLLLQQAYHQGTYRHASLNDVRPADTTYSQLADRGGAPQVVGGYDYSNEDVGQ